MVCNLAVCQKLSYNLSDKYTVLYASDIYSITHSQEANMIPLSILLIESDEDRTYMTALYQKHYPLMFTTMSEKAG